MTSSTRCAGIRVYRPTACPEAQRSQVGSTLFAGDAAAAMSSPSGNAPREARLHIQASSYAQLMGGRRQTLSPIGRATFLLNPACPRATELS